MRGRVMLLAALLGAGGCASWRRVEAPPPDALRATQQVQLWRGGQAEVLHGVAVRGDTVTGIPYHLRLDCDSCRVTRVGYDSLRTGSLEKKGFLVVGGVVLALGTVALILSQIIPET